MLPVVRVLPPRLGVVLFASLHLAPIACASRMPQAPGQAPSSDESRPLSDKQSASEPRYVPDAGLNDNPSVDASLYCFDSQFLRVVEERPFCRASANVEIYRFRWLRTFDHPISIRLEAGDDYVLVSKQTSGKSGFGIGQLITNESHKLTPEQWVRFKALLEELDFWKVNSSDLDSDKREAAAKDEILIRGDGSDWILEGLDHGKYHAVYAWSPRSSGPASRFRELCLYLLSLSGISVATDRIY